MGSFLYDKLSPEQRQDSEIFQFNHHYITATYEDFDEAELVIRILSFGVMGCKSLGLYLVNVCYMPIVIYFRKYIGLVDTKGGVQLIQPVCIPVRCTGRIHTFHQVHYSPMTDET